MCETEVTVKQIVTCLIRILYTATEHMLFEFLICNMFHKKFHKVWECEEKNISILQN